MIGAAENCLHQLGNVARGLWAECAGASVDMEGFTRVEVASVEQQIDGSYLVRIIERVADEPAPKRKASKKDELS